MRRSALRCLLPLVLCLDASGQDEWRQEAEAPILEPKHADPVAIPEPLRKAAEEFGLDLSKVSVFHEPRNILELSYYGARRGIRLPQKVSVIVENGATRFWLANCFPHPDPTTVAGPFTGNAIEKFALPTLIREGLAKRNYCDYIQGISGLLSSDDKELVKLGLEAVPAAMEGDLYEVDNFMHFLERSLPLRNEDFARMGFGRQCKAALASMENGRQRIAAVTVEAERPDYQPGYDPEKERRNGIGTLPKEAWGEEKNGLQGALATPAELEMNERFKLYFVFRNVSDQTVRVSFPETTGNLRIGYKPTPNRWGGGTEGIGGHRQPLTHWTLEPGHQAMVLCRHLQFAKEGELVPKDATEDGKPGVYRLWASTTSRDEWKWLRDGEKKLVAVPKGDWKGYLKTATREFTLLDAAAPVQIVAPRELGRGHGLQPTAGFPEGLDSNRALAIELRPSLSLYLHHDKNTHWLLDHDTYRTTVAWGPMSTARLKQLGFLERIEKNSRDLIAKSPRSSQAFGRLGALVQRSRPLAQLGLRMIPELDLAGADPTQPEFLARGIRNRRLELVRLGLENEMRTALNLLSATDPPLPPAEEFEVITSREIPRGLAPEAWGPENDGLRAAALLPKEIKDGAAPIVRLFLRNISDRDIYLTVADRPGYDYATATDAAGESLPTRRPLLYPMVVFSRISPEIDPGMTRQSPALTNLAKLVMKPGSVFELKTATTLGYRKEKREGPADHRIGMNKDIQEPAMTIITSQPVEALVTWHLRTANGRQHEPADGERTWPARGGWSGILETAPLKVTLRD